MGKFIIHGIVVEEPRKSTTTAGVDRVTLLVEEKFLTPYNKEKINYYSVDFIGKATSCVPEHLRLLGLPVVIMGTLTGREYNGKYYYDLNGDTLSIIYNNNLEPEQASTNVGVVEEPTAPVGDFGDIEITDDDDLPF